MRVICWFMFFSRPPTAPILPEPPTPEAHFPPAPVLNTPVNNVPPGPHRARAAFPPPENTEPCRPEPPPRRLSGPRQALSIPRAPRTPLPESRTRPPGLDPAGSPAAPVRKPLPAARARGPDRTAPAQFEFDNSPATPPPLAAGSPPARSSASEIRQLSHAPASPRRRPSPRCDPPRLAPCSHLRRRFQAPAGRTPASPAPLAGRAHPAPARYPAPFGTAAPAAVAASGWHAAPSLPAPPPTAGGSGPCARPAPLLSRPAAAAIAGRQMRF